MAKQTIAILSPGDMGHAVGRAVLSLGHNVVTTLAGRSERTRALSAKAGLTALADLEAVVAEADLVLSILPPEAAQANAREIAEAMRRADVRPPVADCNAIAPETARSWIHRVPCATIPR